MADSDLLLICTLEILLPYLLLNWVCGCVSRAWLTSYRGTSCCSSRHRMRPRQPWHWPTIRRWLIIFLACLSFSASALCGAGAPLVHSLPLLCSFLPFPFLSGF